MKKQFHISKLFPIFFIFFIFSQSIRSQSSDIYPLHIGVKIGLPNGVGLGAEYVTPLLGNRIAPYADYSYIPFGDFEGSYFDIGSNIYFGNRGKGGYVGIGYGNTDVEISNLSGDTPDDEPYENGVAKEKISTFNLKLGYRSGGRFYFRIEGGYGFGSIPEEIYVTGDVNGMKETFPLGAEDILEYASLSGLPLLNFGFGYSF